MPFLKETEEDYRPVLTPLIDVVFLLIIFFLVSTEFLVLNRRVQIDLPQTEAAEESPRAEKNILDLSYAQGMYLNGKEISAESLKKRISQLDFDKPLLIRADRRVPYGEVMAVMGICQNLGIEKIDAAVKEPGESPFSP